MESAWGRGPVRFRRIDDQPHGTCIKSQRLLYLWPTMHFRRLLQVTQLPLLLVRGAHMSGRSLQAPPGGSTVVVERILPLSTLLITIYRMSCIGHHYSLACRQVMSPTQRGHCEWRGHLSCPRCIKPTNGSRQSSALAYCYPESRADRSLPPLTVWRS